MSCLLLSLLGYRFVLLNRYICCDFGGSLLDNFTAVIQAMCFICHVQPKVYFAKRPEFTVEALRIPALNRSENYVTFSLPTGADLVQCL